MSLVVDDLNLHVNVAASRVGVGTTWCSASAAPCACSGVTFGRKTSRITESWSWPLSLDPMETRAPTAESVMSALALPASSFSAEWKHAV